MDSSDNCINELINNIQKPSALCPDCESPCFVSTYVELVGCGYKHIYNCRQCGCVFNKGAESNPFKIISEKQKIIKIFGIPILKVFVDCDIKSC